MRFIPVRIPETGAHWDAPESALEVHPNLVRLDRPAKDVAGPAKPKKPIRSRRPANSIKE